MGGQNQLKKKEKERLYISNLEGWKALVLGGICVLLIPCTQEVQGFENRNNVCMPLEPRH